MTDVFDPSQAGNFDTKAFLRGAIIASSRTTDTDLPPQRKRTMRTLAVLAVIAAALCFETSNANAQGKYWPWCSRYGWTVVCAYANVQQCQAAVSGAGGFCQPNVVGPPVVERRYAKRVRHARQY